MKKIFVLIGISLLATSTFAQTQIGDDIVGETLEDWSGNSISMPDANTIAVGAWRNDGNGSNSGHVRIYEWNGFAWLQKGMDIDGEFAEDVSGYSVSMPDAITVAIGARGNDGNANQAGHVRVYEWTGLEWMQKGTDIDGEALDDNSGYSVCMPDANTVAIGAPFNDANGNDAGHVRVYSWNNSSWVQKGIDLDGEAAEDQSGWSLSMPNANTIAIGARLNDGNGILVNSGHVRIYEWTGSVWLQKGLDINGESSENLSGQSVSMPNANTVAIGAILNPGNGWYAGHVRIYFWNGFAWVQKGADIDGESAEDRSGFSVSMPDANMVAIGAPLNDGNGSEAGHIRIYKWLGSEWVQYGLDIDGEAAEDFLGFSVSMPDASTVAIGAPQNDGTGTLSGYVKVYALNISSIIENEFGESLRFFPNPSDGYLSIDLGDFYNNVSIIVRNILGQEVQNKVYNTIEHFNILIESESGVYFMEITSKNKKAILKIVKE